MCASHCMVRHHRGENTGTWGFWLAGLFLLIALSVSHDSEDLAQPILSAAQTGNGNPAVRGSTCQMLVEQLWPSPMAECKARSIKAKNSLSTVSSLRLEAGGWKRGRESWRCVHSLPGSLMRGADQEAACVACKLLLFRSACSPLLLIISLTAPAGTPTSREDQLCDKAGSVKFPWELRCRDGHGYQAIP